MLPLAALADTAKVYRVVILSAAPPDQNVLGPDMTRAFAADGLSMAESTVYREPVSVSLFRRGRTGK